MRSFIVALFVLSSPSAYSNAAVAPASCLVFDATAPLTLSDKSVVYPILIPRVTVACTASAELIVVPVSAKCHMIEVKIPKSYLIGMPDRIERSLEAAPKQYTASGLYADSNGNCGTLVKAQSASTVVKASW